MKLPRPERRLFLVKLAVILSGELLAAPLMLAAAVCAGPPDRLLALQNLARQKAIGWLFPEFVAHEWPEG